MFLNISQNSQENTCSRLSFLLKLQALASTLLKKRLRQVLSCEYYEIFKNTFFIELLQTTTPYFISPLLLIREVYLHQEWFYLLKGRSSRPEVFCKKGVLENVAKFTGKHLCQDLFFNKVLNFIKKGTVEQVLSCVLCEIFKNTLFIENFRWNKTMCLRKIWDWKPLKKQ